VILYEEDYALISFVLVHGPVQNPYRTAADPTRVHAV
jgi:hypothetical protein